MILTNYFSRCKDPQRNKTWRPDDAAVMGLVADAERLGVPIVVFHDGLSPEFRENYPHAEFVQVEPHPMLSPNDYRFAVFREWLDRQTGIDTPVWISDLFDVRMNLHPSVMPPCPKLWVGIHNDWRIRKESRIRDERYVAGLIEKHYGTLDPRLVDQPILMAGTWGGSQSSVLEALELIVRDIEALCIGGEQYNANLAVMQTVGHIEIGADQLWMKGAPLHSRFRRFERNAPVVFVHK